ncbi:hypothetical protein TBLA_0A08860 [Henningerozyma blattae CBS 6284]|uniref:1,3-beta-glucanosyltransferase n=1 Tax=Henningerozyma blattae (strain ATCC 34711 / CBS 6284 / DSM 70876 / NBRC 10599 / NRRL Y-10934 / UCD 77-7) TaxID=1071380 RepID=I2GX23_HENB6|nr:hypothetical protein TBLA_0A08860 [Tetrapisispora blattae CBS 6284]CCH58675.1 hypothetical protein TBLA_0A08860 [Tetrapisispora blattae CBS 6284]
MKRYFVKTSIVLTFILLLSRVLTKVNGETKTDNGLINLPIIEIVGNKFFNSETGEQFFMKGIAYQPRRTMQQLEEATGVFETKYLDPLADEKMCLRDIPYLKKLNINTIRVYSIDPEKDHDICMNALSKEGIYVLLDLSEPDVSIVRNEPTWDTNIWERYTKVIDTMEKYHNILGFFAGNEVTNDKTNTHASPFVKAAIRDVKVYIKEKGYREIPVGYSTNDDADTRSNLAKYFICGDVKADFYGINMYEWCGYSSYGTSGYRERTAEFKDYPVPVFFSEFGCNLIRPRPFTEVTALYGTKMSGIWSGGLVYMYFEEENHYGVVKIDPHGNVVELEDFKYLKDEFAKAQPIGTTKEEFLKELNESKPFKEYECPDQFKYPLWKANKNLPPSPNRIKCECLYDNLPCLMSPLIEPENSEYKRLFDYICHEVDCSDIVADGSKGLYGKYSDCSVYEKLSLEISKFYYQLNKNDRVCPITHKNVFYNIKSERTEDNVTKCKDIINTFKEHVTNNRMKSSSIAKEEDKDKKGTTKQLARDNSKDEKNNDKAKLDGSEPSVVLDTDDIHEQYRKESQGNQLSILDMNFIGALMIIALIVNCIY